MTDPRAPRTEVVRTRLRVTGTVQGVGFRPFVYRHAVALGLSGFVLNDSSGVLVEVEGPTTSVVELTRLLINEAPTLARVSGVSAESLPPNGGPTNFRIVESQDRGSADVPISIDTSTCDDCLADINDPLNRRFGYAFTNCTNCGPRYTIVLSVPYDRPATTMANFALCTSCRAEYDDPLDRRFHAQPNACPVCGPQLMWRTSGESTGGSDTLGSAALRAACELVLGGGLLAMKGIGGYHLVADATNTLAVAELRRRKARDDKPFALMVGSLAEAIRLCTVDDVAAQALSSIRSPIVLLPRRTAGDSATKLAAGVAPGLHELGLMLPYSPLHHLLLARIAKPLVMTSGNLSDEPIAHDDDDALKRLSPLVDGFLIHNRPIHIRCDDSVVRSKPGRLQTLRRSRGYAPEPLPLPFHATKAIIAVGAEMKNTVSVARNDWVVASHHIGDLEHLSTFQSFRQAVEHLARLYGVVPELVAHDMHPEYLSTKFAMQLDLPTIAVQHHHAHVAACMVEHGRTDKVLGLTYDGLGFGPDGSLWGGEMLIADMACARRVGHLRSVGLPGGAAAIREPWRMAAVWAAAALGADEAVTRLQSAVVDEKRLRAVLALSERPLTVSTTSVGRLFDAVAALLGGRQRVSYEAQAAIELEALAGLVDRRDAPSYAGTVIVGSGTDGIILDPSPLIGALLEDQDAGVCAAALAAGFHEAMGNATVIAACQASADNDLDTVVLTGGVFQNARFSEIVETGLTRAGLHVLTHGVVPPNDGGISIGQAAIAAFSTA